MGTETKFNNCTSNDGVCIAKLTTLPNSSATTATQNGHSNGVTNGKDTILKKTSKKIEIPKQTTSTVPFVPIRIDENDVVEGAKELLKYIRPDWDLNEVEFKKFTDGITNKLVGCFYNHTDTSSNGSSKKSIKTNGNNTTNGNNKTNGHSSNNGTKINTTATKNGHMRSYDDNDDSGNLSDSDTDSDASTNSLSESSCNSNVVLVRVYGNKTDLLIDRKAEMRNILLMHSYGFAPPLYATFKNGLAYDYVPGVTLNTNNVLKPDVWRLVATRMAEMHRLVKPNENDGQSLNMTNRIPMLWKKTQSFLDLVPERFSDDAKQKRLEGTFLPIDRMRNEFAYLYKRLESLGSPIVFAHNDLLLGNVVYNETLQRVNFIDYEYADYNFQAFDIGNHFAEFAGVDEVDYSRYPTREFQYEWLRVYLQVYLEKSNVSDAEVHRLYVQVNQFSLAAHIFWIIWCLIQAEHSKIDFDYVEYAFIRYKEYLAKKDELLALDLNGSS